MVRPVASVRGADVTEYHYLTPAEIADVEALPARRWNGPPLTADGRMVERTRRICEDIWNRS